MDLEAVETTLRAALLAEGPPILAGLLNGIGSGRQDAPVLCPRCRIPMESHGRKTKTVVTMVGCTPFSRSMFECPRCDAVRFPGDEALGIVNTTRSPGVLRLVAFVAHEAPFSKAARQLDVLAGLHLSVKDVERIAEGVGKDMMTCNDRMVMQYSRAESVASAGIIPVMYIEADGTGTPMVKRELEGRRGKQPDGKAKTREAKIGCVFTQTTTDEQGRAVRDPGSTTLVGRIESSEAFGKRLYAEAVRRGLFEAAVVVFLGDGAPWLRTLVETHFPRAVHIIDLFHAKEHVALLTKLLFYRDDAAAMALRNLWWEHLEKGEIEVILTEGRQLLKSHRTFEKEIEGELAYLEKNKNRMRYAWFRARGFFVGSGVVEAACRTIVGERLKKSGMKWTKDGANDIIALRCTYLSNSEEDYWEQRATAGAKTH